MASNKSWEIGDFAWCEEFGIVEVEETYPGDGTYPPAVDVQTDADVTETTNLSNLKETAPVSEWKWENSDVDMVMFHGYDPQGRKVARRIFERTSTDVFANGGWEEREDSGSWNTAFGGKGIPVNE